MLFLLRKIRRKLMKKNKFTTYLLYAIGEIFLVVIGILIAVSINNWNEKQKNTNLELKILKEIQVDLQKDLDEIREEIGAYAEIEKADSILYAFYLSNEVFSDSIGFFIFLNELSPHFNPINGGYQFLKSKGIDLISNDSLRLQINGYYEQAIPYYQKYESERLHTVLNDFVPFNNRNFTLSTDNGEFLGVRKPIDEKILRSPQWIAIVQKSKLLADIQGKLATGLENQTLSLEKKIRSELELRSTD